VPHYHSTILDVLEGIATFAARVIGVVLLSRDPDLTRAFVAAQPHPERFSVVTAPYDTPWLRDRSPFAVRVGNGHRWLVTRLHPMERPLDEVLFTRISRRPLDEVPIVLPQGNVVAGPGGVTITTRRVLDDNRDADEATLKAAMRRLGVRRWIVSRTFAGETTGHADVYARFLHTRLLAVAWSETLAADREVAGELEARVRGALPDIEVLKLPLRSEGPLYASPLNWVHVGRTLLVPRYPLTPPADVDAIQGALGRRGFRVDFVESPTLEFGGSLHCLTASVYV
jgi:agmatine/peptidylarginine deiminase